MLALTRPGLSRVAGRSLVLGRAIHTSRILRDEPSHERPEPKRATEDTRETKSFPKGKLFMLSSLVALGGYGYYSHDENVLRELGVKIQTQEPGRTLQIVFGLPIRVFYRAKRKLNDFYLYFADPPKPQILPPLDLPPNSRIPITLVVDLDETLVHTEWTREHGMRVRRRPFTREFLQRMAQAGFEVVIFSSTSMYMTDGIVAALDPKGQFIYHRLSKEYTVYRDGQHIKDLSRLNRDLSRVVIIDDNPECYSLHPENAIPITAWTGDRSDTALRNLIPYLEYLSASNVKDVREELKQLAGKDVSQVLKQKTEKLLEKHKRITGLLGDTFLGPHAVTAQDVLNKTKGEPSPPPNPTPTPTPTPTATPANAPEQPEKVGKVWQFLKRKNDQSLLEEQRIQEQWTQQQKQQQQQQQSPQK